MGTRAFRAVITALFVLTGTAIAPSSASAAPSASVVPSQNQVSFSVLQGVDCVAPTDCWAVGWWDGSTIRTLIERWNGTSWKVVPSPNADWAENSRLSAVSCVSSTDCTAVGEASSLSSHDLDRPIDPLFLHWDGSAWTVVPGPRNGPASFIYDQLEAVDCPATDFCLAVGHRHERTLAMRWNGTAWAKVPSLNRETYSRGPNTLSGIACRGRANCFAVGSSRGERRNDSSQNWTLIERWDGTRFRMVASPNPEAGRDNVLEAVSCPAAKMCIATGFFGNGPRRTLVQQWNGSKWKVAPSPTPGKQNSSSLSGVACMSATRCFAAGARSDLSRALTLAQWNGKAWKLVAAPRIAAQQRSLRGVACTKGACFAVGERDFKTLVVRYR